MDWKPLGGMEPVFFLIISFGASDYYPALHQRDESGYYPDAPTDSDNGTSPNSSG